MIKMLFVCMGNICRSPTAHAVMQHTINQRGWAESFTVDSAGTHAYHIGEQSDPRSRAKAAEKGIDMEFVRARKITTGDFHDFDYIFAMDTENLELVEQAAPAQHSAKIHLFLHFALAAGLTTQCEVPDPYYGAADGFEEVYKLVALGCDALLDEVIKVS